MAKRELRVAASDNKNAAASLARFKQDHRPGELVMQGPGYLERAHELGRTYAEAPSRHAMARED